jgi:SMC interacting uncharacterized protein involved in chromosome segregation
MKKFYSADAEGGSGHIQEENVTKDSTPLDIETELKNMPGALAASLTRKNSQIKADRGLAIAETLRMKYKREIEDLVMKIRKLKLEQANSIDFSPTNADSLILGKDVDETQFVANDMSKAIEIENAEIKLRLARQRYHFLFGDNI